MSNAPAMPDQTPVSFVLAGGFDMSDEACRKALAACGINPDNFDDYNGIAATQSAARQDVRQRTQQAAQQAGRAPGSHVAPCTGGAVCRCHESQLARDTVGNQQWLQANAESGHISQNAFYQTEGNRGDPCANIPPSAGNGGTYGYDMDRALCMDHSGRANLPGTPHHAITRTEAEYAREMQAASPGGPATAGVLENGARRSAEIAVAGPRGRYDDDPTRLARAQRFTDEQRQQAERQTTQQASQAAGGTGSAGGASPSAVAPTTGSTPLSPTQQHAVECIIAKWKKSLNDMRQDAVNNYGPGSSQSGALAAHNAGPPPVTPPVQRFDQLTPAQQQTAVDRRQQQLQAGNAGPGPGTAQRPPGSPTANDCREYQANWLWRQSAGATPPRTGFPPMEGRIPGTPPPTTSGASAGGGNSTF